MDTVVRHIAGASSALRRCGWSGAIALFGVVTMAAVAAADCPDAAAVEQRPDDLTYCAALEPDIRQPGKFPLDVYETKLQGFLQRLCHRNTQAGWLSDKRMRDTGPFLAGFDAIDKSGQEFGTHTAVVIWYSPDMVAWIEKNRRDGASEDASTAVPDGAVIIKEMYKPPAAACADVPPLRLKPSGHGAAVMVRDSKAVQSGWFWGWFGWSGSGWSPDWPAPASNAYPNMGFGQYCVNCHASARNNLTFSSLANLAGKPGIPLVFLSQGIVPTIDRPGHHEAVANPPRAARSSDGQSAMAFMATLGLFDWPVPTMPSESLDSVWARPRGHGGKLDGFVTSDQCIGCHDAGSTGLQFDMTSQPPGGPPLVNLSPYALWRASPMGLAGRDPIFFAQLASETQTLHPETPPGVNVDDVCLGCHGVLGQRAVKAAAQPPVEPGSACPPMTRDMLNPVPTGKPFPASADFAGLGRDGISCLACHRMALWPEAEAFAGQPDNSCLAERRKILNPGATKTAARFTGSFEFGPTDRVIGPFQDPRQLPMKTALGMAPVHASAIGSSELCGSCHTIDLPVLPEGRHGGTPAVITNRYEQTTYAEWAFSAFRTGWAGGEALPAGAGAKAQSCQGCHLPSTEADGHPTRSKIASIEEYSNFPQAANAAKPAAIDLPGRTGFARHTLVGLNYVLVTMAYQFWDLLGLRVQDPMLVANGIDPLATTQKAILDQAKNATAGIALTDVAVRPPAGAAGEAALEATVTVTNRTGHKFPSGVGFRRAFVTVTVRDDAGNPLWVSGGTDGSGVILDGNRQPLSSELWWAPNCAYRIAPEKRDHQPHRQVITRQDEVQIYEDLTSTPGDEPNCGPKAPAAGRLTTSFLSRCTSVKDNRILPEGFLKLEERKRIAAALGARDDLADEAGANKIGEDPDYRDGAGGSDSLRYRIPLRDLAGAPASVEAELSYQSTAPYFLQDRLCTAKGQDTARLAYMTANLDLSGTPAAGWRLRIGDTGRVPVAFLDRDR